MSENDILDISQFIKFKSALSKLVANPELFKAAIEAYEKEDVGAFKAVLTELGIINYCWLVCRWFCVKKSGALCIILCPRTGKIQEPTIEEMLDFGRATIRLMDKKEGFKNLFEAYKQKEAKKFQAILNNNEMMRFCTQFCRWFSDYYCTIKCRILCPPIAKIISPSGLACIQPESHKIDGKIITGIKIKGIATGGSPFLNYRLEYSSDGGTTWRQDAPGSGDVIIIYPDGNRGGVSIIPVGPSADTLRYFETTNLPGQIYGLKLTVTSGGGMVTIDTTQFQLHQKAVVIDEVGRIDITVTGSPPSRKLILDGRETAIGGYATIGGSAYIEGCGKRYKKYKLMWTDGWTTPPGPTETYDSVEAPGSKWKRILEVDYTGMPIFICFHNNSPVGDLTRRWSKKNCWLVPGLDFDKLIWSPWNSIGSGKATLLLAVQDDSSPSVSYFDSLQIWIDNIVLEGKLDSIGIPGIVASKCEPLSIKEIIKSGGILEISGTAWDDEIITGDLTQPSLNFNQFTIGWKKNCDPNYKTNGIQLMPLADPGKKRIKNNKLAEWNINGLDLEPCAYIIRLDVWDNSRINDHTVHHVHKELAFTLKA